MKILLLVASFVFSSQILASNKTCFGTEPFWNMKVSESHVSFNDFSSEADEVSEIISKDSAAGTGLDFVTVIKTEEKVITTIQNSCNDGMSDEIYPFEVVVTDNESGLVLYGCCK